MMLAQLAFQVVVVDMMPKSGEVTYLSKYMSGAMFLCGLIMLQNVLTFYLVQLAVAIDIVFACFAVFWIVMHIYVYQHVDDFRMDWVEMDEEDQGNLTEEWMLYDADR